MAVKSVKFVAEIAHVREVSLLGTANLGFWRDRLKDEQIILAEKDGQAQILMIAAAARYLGMQFQEVSFSLLLDGFQGERIAGAYLLQAFNSSRLFAFCERTLFSTPYHYANILVECALTCVQVVESGQTVFQAEMTAPDASTEHRADGWQGPVLLPRRRGTSLGGRKLFFAKIRGDTRTHTFNPVADRMRLSSLRGHDVIQDLIDSRFDIKEWSVRGDATHQKSKTYTSSPATMELARAFVP
jgi:hypothetical protein